MKNAVAGLFILAGVVGFFSFWPRLTAWRFVEGGMALSPDGTALVASIQEGGGPRNLYRIQLGDRVSVARRLTDHAADDVDPAYSPDGTALVHSSGNEKSGMELYEMNLATGHTRALTRSAAHEREPCYLPDGRRIVFARAMQFDNSGEDRDRWVDWDLYLLDTVSSEERRLTTRHFYGVTRLAVSPDGWLLLASVITHSPAGQYQIFSIPISLSGEATPLTHQVTSDVRASAGFSPRGDRIVFVSSGESTIGGYYDYEIFMMTPDGQNPVQVTRAHSYSSHPIFSKDMKTLYFLSDPGRNDDFRLSRLEMVTDQPDPIFLEEMKIEFDD